MNVQQAADTFRPVLHETGGIPTQPRKIWHPPARLKSVTSYGSATPAWLAYERLSFIGWWVSDPL